MSATPEPHNRVGAPPERDEWRALVPVQVVACTLATGLAVWGTRQALRGMRLADRFRRAPHGNHRTSLIWWALLGVIYAAVLLTYVGAAWVALRLRASNAYAPQSATSGSPDSSRAP